MKREPGELKGYGLTRFKDMAEKLRGIQKGLYIIGADTNAGKTALLSNLLLDLLETNEDLTGIFVSMDDPKETIINRLLAIQTGIDLEEVENRQHKQDKQTKLDQAYKHLENLCLQNRFYLMDSEDIESIEDIGVEIEKR